MAVPCTLIPGDGIGPDITDATVRVLEAAGAKFDWDRRLAGMAAVGKFDDPMPDETIESIERTGLALKGPLETPVGGGYRSVNVALRRKFDLYANVRPARSVVSGGRFENVDIVHGDTGRIPYGMGTYGSRSIAVGGTAAESIAVVTRFGSERIFVMRSSTPRTGGRK
jgi:isocitrate dehydrogenase (NAD+)